MDSTLVLSAEGLETIVKTIVVSSGIVYIIAFIALVWIVISVVDFIDAYKWRRKMPIILAAEMIKKTEESLDKMSFDYGTDYE